MLLCLTVGHCCAYSTLKFYVPLYTLLLSMHYITPHTRPEIRTCLPTFSVFFFFWKEVKYILKFWMITIMESGIKIFPASLWMKQSGKLRMSQLPSEVLLRSVETTDSQIADLDVAINRERCRLHFNTWSQALLWEFKVRQLSFFLLQLNLIHNIMSIFIQVSLYLPVLIYSKFQSPEALKRDF